MKFIGAISSIVSGIMAFVCLSLANIGGKLSLLGFTSESTMNGWDIIEADVDASGATLFKIFAIAAIVLGVILILYGLFMILVDLKVIKIKSKLNFYVINNILLSIFVIFALLCFIGVWTWSGDWVNGFIGVGAWLMLIIPAVLCLCSWLFARKQGK